MNKMLTVGTKFSGTGKIPILGSSRLKTLNSIIKVIFSKGEQGFAYDPNDLTTLYQDAAGTVPVTGAGQPVGLVKDKSGRNNHAFQTVSASRPILQQTPILGDELVVNGDFATNNLTGWTRPDSAPSVTTVANQRVTLTAAAGAGATLARLRQVVSVSAGEYVVSLNVVSITATPQGSVALGNATSGDSTYGLIGLNRVGKFEQKITVATGILGLAFTAGSVNGGSIVLDDISIKRLISYRTDQNYLAFDGVDDFLQTNNIDFTATDRMSLFAGVRKMSDATTGSVCELADGSNMSLNTFALFAPAATGVHKIDFRNALTDFGASTTDVKYSAPVSVVVMGKLTLKDAIKARLRLNGLAISASTKGFNTNLVNAPLYIGRRGGTSLPFNGHLYGLIGIGRLTTDSETAALEKVIAKNVGVTLNV